MLTEACGGDASQGFLPVFGWCPPMSDLVRACEARECLATAMHRLEQA